VSAIGGAVNPLLNIVGFGVGHAIGPILRPPIQDLVNEAWQTHPVRPLSADTAAALWVEGAWTPARAKEEGSFTGIDGARMDVLRDLIDNPPDVATMFALWRRNLVSEAEFDVALRRLRIEPEWFAAIKATRNRLLTPEELAAARVKGHIDQARQYAESELSGVTNDRAQIMYETTGNPPGPETLITMLNRGIISGAEFAAGIKQGNIRPEYVDEYLALRHRILTANEVVNLRLRGWIGDAEMVTRGAAAGYDADTMHDLFLGHGRPISFRQVFIGGRRGGVYDGPVGELDAPFLKSLQESNVRPEWYNLAWAQRHSLPSAFVIRGLAQSGDITPAVARELLEWSGWPEFLIDAVVSAWTGAEGGADSSTVKSARTQAITEIRSAYILGQADDGAAQSWLGAIGVAPETTAELLPIWNVMREVPQKGLTAAQIKAAYRKLPAQWPRARALDELQQLGFTADDAATLLDS
jgi:hypothetical protein